MRRLTLVELAIVVAIVATLAAIAIPSLMSMQFKAKRSEILVNLDGMVIAVRAYQTSHDNFPMVFDGPRPRAIAALDKKAVAWEGAEGPLFPVIGWAPDGPVRGAYGLTINDIVGFTTWSSCDVDDDGAVASAYASPLTAPRFSTPQDRY